MSEPTWRTGPPTSDGWWVVKRQYGGHSIASIIDGRHCYDFGDVVSHYGPIPDEPPPPEPMPLPRRFRAKYRGVDVVGVRDPLPASANDVQPLAVFYVNQVCWLGEDDLTDLRYID